MGHSYGHRRIFLPAFTCLDFGQIWPYPRHNPMQRPQAPAWQASPWGHRPSSSAPCAVPMRLSRIDQHIKEEPCAKQRALLGVFSSRYSSRFSRCPICWSIFTNTPLVLQYLYQYCNTCTSVPDHTAVLLPYSTYTFIMQQLRTTVQRSAAALSVAAKDKKGLVHMYHGTAVR